MTGPRCMLPPLETPSDFVGVYFAVIREHCKIGFTTRSLERRLNDTRHAGRGRERPRLAALLPIAPDAVEHAREIERDVFEELAAFRRGRTEWFDLRPYLRRFLVFIRETKPVVGRDGRSLARAADDWYAASRRRCSCAPCARARRLERRAAS